MSTSSIYTLTKPSSLVASLRTREVLPVIRKQFSVGTRDVLCLPITGVKILTGQVDHPLGVEETYPSL